MSEYQYYEFLAIDRPLTMKEMSTLRELSTRAHITPVSFTNEYNWGDFKGSPLELMRRFFDAHVYVANWMTAIFMVRLPIETLPKRTVEAMAVDGVLDFERTDTHWVITWRLEESEDYDRFGVEDGRGWMARLAPVRDELLRGDVRSLYIGWLAGVTRDMTEDDDLEPALPEGLGNLTGAQQALAEFMEVDEDLLEGACIGSPSARSDEPSQKDMDEWLGELPHEETLALLKELLAGRGLQAERTLRNRFLSWSRGRRGDLEVVRRRSVEELREHAEMASSKRIEQKKLKQAQLDAKRREERVAYLVSLAKDFPKAWKTVQRQVERGTGAAYDEACRTLADISDAYVFLGRLNNFSQELKRFVAVNVRRKTLVQRLVKSGIWHE